MNTDKNLLVHIDIDSPLKLLDFYQLKGVDYNIDRLERFYTIAFDRALDFFEKNKIQASFFVVGNELETNSSIRKIILQTHEAGHEIENHTYSHPFGLSTLSNEEVNSEVKKCNEIIAGITGTSPTGFRSPGYSIDSRIINILRGHGLTYDSSGFWSIMNPILKNTHKLLFRNGLRNPGFGHVTRQLGHAPYQPDHSDWLIESKTNPGFWELPLPRTATLGLPFYNNFNLWAPGFYSNLVSNTINKPYMVYLFHIIEFMDLTDDIPPALEMHPNLKMSLKKKLDFSSRLISNLKKRYTPIKTGDYIQSMGQHKI